MAAESIPFDQISFVVQGPVDTTISRRTGKPMTQSCLESIRQWFPGSEIVLSIWKGSDVSGLDFDQLIENDDPGAFNVMRPEALRPVYNNGNRQIVSTASGLRAVSRCYAAKVRTDLVLTGNQWLGQFNGFPARSPRWRIFKERIVTASLYTRNPVRGIRKPFHPSDWLMFGLTEDMLLLWDIPLEPEPQSAHWFQSRPYPRGVDEKVDMRRYNAEQYVWKTLLSKYGSVRFDNFADASAENIRLTRLTFANNLIILDPDQYTFELQKYEAPRRGWVYSCFTHREWYRLYREYSCGEKLAPAFERATDLRHLYEGCYCRIPESLRGGLFKASAFARQVIGQLPPKSTRAES